MDTLRLETKFIRSIVGNYISKLFRKKTGHDINLDIHTLKIDHGDDGATISCSLTAKMPEKDITALTALLLKRIS